MKTLNYALMMTVSAAFLMTASSLPAHAKAMPASEKPAPTTEDAMDRADGDMKKVLEELKKLGGKPIETLSAKEARLQPTPTDAVNNVLKADGKNPEELKAKMKVTTKDLMYPAGKGEQKARVYIPDEKSDKPLPVLVYYHGGGFVIADIDVYDAAPRALAKQAKAIVVSIEYRKAPENKFPAAYDDAYAAYKWVLANAASWGGDASKVAVAGESAGANLAANVAIKARDEKIQAPAHMLLVYPVAGNDMNTESYKKNANAKPLNKAMMAWFVKNFIRTPKDKDSTMINLLAANLKGLPSATVITAEIDPLQSEGKMLADRLKDAGSKVDYADYEGVTHEFFGMAAVVSDAASAQAKAASDLDDAFDKVEDKK